MARMTVSDEEWIRRKGDEARRAKEPIFLERTQRPGWSGPMNLYLVWCKSCQAFSVTYPAGYGRVNCGHCRKVHRIDTRERLRRDEIQGDTPIDILAVLPRVLLVLAVIAYIVLRFFRTG